MVLCLEEACTNAIRHSGSTEPLTVRLWLEGDLLRVLVRDHGVGFDTARFHREEVPSAEAAGGRGLFLISQVMDQVELRAVDGLEVRADKRITLRGACRLRQRHMPDRERQMLTAIMEGLPAGAEYLDRDFTIQIVNRQFERNIGMDRDRLVGRDHFDVLPSTGLRRFLERARDAGRGSEFKALPVELPARPERGLTYWDWRVAPVLDGTGAVGGLLLSSVDVTQEIKTQRFSDALSRISLKLTTSADGRNPMDEACRLAADAMGCDSLILARLDRAVWTSLHAIRFNRPSLPRVPGHWPELSLGSVDPSYIGDWRVDTRVSSDWKTAWPVHACLMAPLVRGGRVTGGLFFGTRERIQTFEAADREFARRCAAVMSASIENRRLVGELQRVAVTLQENLLHPLPTVAGLQFAFVSQPAHAPDLVGGDFHDVFKADEGHVVVLIGDVAGKGLRAAGLTETVRTAIRAYATVDHSPGYVMRKTSELLEMHELGPDQFVTAFLAVIELHTGLVRYVSAGHPPAVLAGQADTEYLTPDFVPPLGAWTGDFPVAEARLVPGDMMVLFTDGVTEARSSRGFFGERRVLRTVRALSRKGVQDVAEGLRDAAAQFGGELRDDLEVLAVRFVGVNGTRGPR